MRKKNIFKIKRFIKESNLFKKLFKIENIEVLKNMTTGNLESSKKLLYHYGILNERYIKYLFFTSNKSLQNCKTYEMHTIVYHMKHKNQFFKR